MEATIIRAVVFAKNLNRLTAFYSEALGMLSVTSDASHCVFRWSGFELIVHQIPAPIADSIAIERPPTRRVDGAIRLDFRVDSVDDARRLARSLGGDIDESPPPWAAQDASFYLGYDPEGNQFGVSQWTTS